jgi:hypothetical protein
MTQVAETFPGAMLEDRDFMRVSVRNTFLDVSGDDPWMLGAKLNLRRQQTDSILHQNSSLRDELSGCSRKMEAQLPECSWKVESLLPEFLTVPMAMPIGNGYAIGINEETCATPSNDEEDSEENSEEYQDSSESSQKDPQVNPEMETLRHIAANGGGVSGCTTVMMRELPLKYTQRKLLREINSSGFGGQFDYLYLPMDPRSHANRGFAFINMVSEKAAEEFYKKFHGQYLRCFSTTVEKPIAVSPADLQGFEENALQYAATANRGKRTGHTKPIFFRSLPRHIEAQLNESKQQPPAPPKQQPPAAVAQRLPQRPARRPDSDTHKALDVQETLAAVLQQALLPALLQASLSVATPQQAAAPQRPCFCCYCGKKRHPDHIFCGHCGRHFDR